jgi:hypothetical protein
LLLKSWKGINLQVLMKFWKNWFKQEAIIKCETHKLINSIWNKEELPLQWKESIVVPIHD